MFPRGRIKSGEGKKRTARVEIYFECEIEFDFCNGFFNCLLFGFRGFGLKQRDRNSSMTSSDIRFGQDPINNP